MHNHTCMHNYTLTCLIFTPPIPLKVDILSYSSLHGHNKDRETVQKQRKGGGGGGGGGGGLNTPVG